MTVHIYNSLGRTLQALEPQELGHVRMYVCGITVYDHCHMGHARVNVAFDVVQRWLRVRGYRVTYVRNITDIDDKIIQRAVQNKEPISTLTQRMVQAMHEDFDALGIERPTHEPRATHYIPQMVSLIDLLQQRGLAYQADDMLYSVRAFKEYGKLSGKSLQTLRAGERVEVDAGKREALDFVLWKSAKPQEPTDAQWDSPWGRGRPGWHIECSAMCHAVLGATVDIHGGGADLQFPHHENEIAQSEGAYGQPLAKIWMHGGFLNVDNQKMSKSLGNFFTIRQVLQHYDAQTLRLFIIRTHYRSPLQYSQVHLDDARAALRRLYTALAQVPLDAEAAPAVDWSQGHALRFAQAMDMDFGTPEAVAVLFDVAAELNRNPSPSLAHLLRALAGCLGLLQQDAQQWLQAGPVGSTGEKEVGLSHAAVEALIAQRQQAKAQRDFAQADALRMQLQSQGIALKDGPTGTTWERVAKA